MEYQKLINLLDNVPNHPNKCKTKNWVEINDKSRGTQNNNSQIKFKTSTLRSSLCDYSGAYILAKGTISVAVVFKNCDPFTEGLSEISNMQIGNEKYIDVIMSMYNLIEHSNNYS